MNKKSRREGKKEEKSKDNRKVNREAEISGNNRRGAKPWAKKDKHRKGPFAGSK